MDTPVTKPDAALGAHEIRVHEVGDRLEGVGDRELLQLFLDPGFPPQPGKRG